MADLEVDPTPINTSVFLPYVIHAQLGRFLVWHEVSSTREHRVVRPSLGYTKVPISGVDAATESLYYTDESRLVTTCLERLHARSSILGLESF